MLQEEMQHQKERQEARLDDLLKKIQQIKPKPTSEQHQQGDPNPNPTSSELAEYFKTISTQNAIVQERKNIIRISKLAWIDHGFKLDGRDNFALWKRAILRDAEYIGARELLENGQPEERQMDPVKRAEIETNSMLLHIRIFARNMATVE